MVEAVEAYRHVSASGEFKELERLRMRAKFDEANALSYARRQGARQEREVWQGVVAEKDKELTKKDKAIAEKDRMYAAALEELTRLRARDGL